MKTISVGPITRWSTPRDSSRKRVRLAIGDSNFLIIEPTEHIRITLKMPERLGGWRPVVLLWGVSRRGGYAGQQQTMWCVIFRNNRRAFIEIDDNGSTSTRSRFISLRSAGKNYNFKLARRLNRP